MIEKKKIAVICIILLLITFVYNLRLGEIVLTKDEMIGDLAYLEASLIENHPILNDEQEIKKYNTYITNLRNTLKRKEDVNVFYFTVSKALAYFNDGHTSIDYYQDYDDYINLDIIWINNEMYVENSNNILFTGDKIVRIGDYQPKELLELMRDIIPSDNEGWLKYRIQQLLPQKKYLNYLGIIDYKDQVTLDICRINNQVETININLNPYNSNLEKQNNSFPNNYYNIDHINNVAIMNLKYLEHNERSAKFLQSFFEEVKVNNIDRVIIDLRESPGGDSSFISDLIKYYDINYYIDLNYNKKFNYVNKEFMYNGITYILTSKETFSSASALAAIFKYNNIGIIIGEPTGTAAYSYGNTVTYTLPNSNITYKVATSAFEQPCKDDELKDAIYPDINITLTPEDLVEKKDPILNYILYDKK